MKELFKHNETDVKELYKAQKIKSVASHNIRLIVSKILTETNYSYTLIEKEDTCILRIEITKEAFIELHLPYETFIDYLEHIIPTIGIVQKLLKELHLSIVLYSPQDAIKWGVINTETFYSRFEKVTDEDKEEKGLFEIGEEVYHRNELTDNFWNCKLYEYCQQTLLNGAREEEAFKLLNTKEIASWTIPNMEVQIEEHCAQFLNIKYYIDNKFLFEIDGYEIDFKFTSSCRFRFWTEKLPKLPQWKQFLFGFFGFYSANLPLCKTVLKNELNTYKQTKKGQSEIVILVNKIMENMDYEYTIDLDGGFYNYNYKNYKALLKVKLPNTQVQQFELPYLDYKEKIVAILPTIKAVEKAIGESGMSFNLKKR